MVSQQYEVFWVHLDPTDGSKIQVEFLLPSATNLHGWYLISFEPWTEVVWAKAWGRFEPWKSRK